MDSVTKRFWKKVKINKTDPDACWNWIGGINGDGYGLFSYDGKLTPAHRVAYVLANGPIRNSYKSRNVLRTCTNRLCCNPKHMVLGSLSRAHAMLGIANNDLRRGRKRLSEKQNKRIATRAERGDSAVDICKSYPNVHYRTILKRVHKALKQKK